MSIRTVCVCVWAHIIFNVYNIRDVVIRNTPKLKLLLVCSLKHVCVDVTISNIIRTITLVQIVKQITVIDLDLCNDVQEWRWVMICEWYFLCRIRNITCNLLIFQMSLRNLHTLRCKFKVVIMTVYRHSHSLFNVS